MDILKPPKQARSRATLARIERAAIGLIAEKGPDGANVQDITRRAKSSVGSFYARFDGKDELMAFLRARVWQDVRERWDESGTTSSLRDGAIAGAAEPKESDAGDGAQPQEGLDSALFQLAGRIIRAFEPDARARRILETHRSPADVEDRARELVDHLAGDTAESLADHGSEIGHPHPQHAVRLALAFMIATARELTETESLNALRGDLGVAELTVELWRMARGYLRQGPGGSDAAPKDGPAQIEFFDVWG